MVYASVAHLWIFMVEIVTTFCFSVQQHSFPNPFCFRNQHFIHWIHWNIYSDHAIAMIRIVFNPSWWKFPSCLGWTYLLPPKSQEFSKFVHHRPLRKKTSEIFWDQYSQFLIFSEYLFPMKSLHISVLPMFLGESALVKLGASPWNFLEVHPPCWSITEDFGKTIGKP